MPTARYMRKYIKAPTYAPNLTKIPKVRDTPTKRSPNIKSQSTSPDPASELKKLAKGPCTPNWRNPVVGEPPTSHAFSGAVAKPNPQTLSTKAQRKIRPIESRRIPRTALNLFDSMF